VFRAAVSSAGALERPGREAVALLRVRGDVVLGSLLLPAGAAERPGGSLFPLPVTVETQDVLLTPFAVNRRRGSSRSSSNQWGAAVLLRFLGRGKKPSNTA